MRLYILAIRDRASDAYNRPIFTPSIGQALRSFQDEVNRAADDNELFKHPEDFDLYQLGEFDDNLGRFANLEQPKQIAIGKDLKA